MCNKKEGRFIGVMKGVLILIFYKQFTLFDFTLE